MKNASSHLVFVILALLVLFSCSKDDDGITPCSANWAIELSSELTAIGTAFSNYSMDQSEANCNALKNAYQQYIDALRPFGKCSTLSGADRAEWQKAIDEAEEDLDSIC